ncbi:MAG: thermonuclease family protein [Lentisphaeria bacterium]|nr:thermonuclease family protein [Lentisphaeria bacterium]NQZ67829.1 thermonuclease family protein [Lentisphaeria bacterium]
MAAEKSFTAKVIRIIDGDTCVVLVAKKELKIRLYGIDAPEKKQAFGAKSKKMLADLILNKNISLTVKSKKSDPLMVCDIVRKYPNLKNGADVYKIEVNYFLIIKGYAWYLKDGPQNKKFAKAHETASKDKRGLWALKNPVAPWKWRKKNK